MPIEITRSANAIYRINPLKRTEIQTRKAAPYSRWRLVRVCATEEIAAQEMIRLARGAPQKTDG